MTPSLMSNGYLTVTLWRDGRQHNMLAHRLVVTAFIGEQPDGEEVRHRDGDRLNNSADNLEWGTRSANILDQVDHGTHGNASKDECPQGHPYDDANTYVYPGPKAHRGCRACQRQHGRAWSAKKKEKVS